jgi:uncharacterized protein
MKLPISDQLSLPADAATQKIAFIGRTGSGKTYGAGVMVEKMLLAGIQVVILDPVGVWYGLRMPAHVSFPGFAIPVFGGLHGDIPLESTAGALVADLVVDKGMALVLDVSQFESDADKARFARAFADRFFFLKKSSPSPVHLVIEECQEFIPQEPRGDETHMLHAFTRMWKLGRNFGIGGSLITQRPQEVSKKVLNQTELLFAFQMTGSHERKAIKEWAGDKGVERDLVDELPGLAVGSCFAWSPQWLRFNDRITFREKMTVNTSSTPTSGERVKSRSVTPVDLHEISEQMKATVERAKDNDPKELKAKIRDLQGQLASAPSKMVVRDVRILDKDDVTLLSSTLSRLQEIASKLPAMQRDIADSMHVFADLGKRIERARTDIPPVQIPSTKSPVDRKREELRGSGQNIVADAVRVVLKGISDGALTPPLQKILAVVWMLGARRLTPNREMVARWLDLHPNGGTYNTNLGHLRREGYIDGFTFLEKAADTFIVLPTGFDAALHPLDDGQRRIMEFLRDNEGKTFTREGLAEGLVLHPNGGTYNTNLGRLRCMGLIPERGEIYLTEAALR